MARRNIPQMLSAIEAKVDQLAELLGVELPEAEPPPTLPPSIDALEVSMATWGVLRRAGIQTVPQLEEWAPDLTELPGVGRRRAAEIDAALKNPAEPS